jgi:hypothetical protein
LQFSHLVQMHCVQGTSDGMPNKDGADRARSCAVASSNPEESAAIQLFT